MIFFFRTSSQNSLFKTLTNFTKKKNYSKIFFDSQFFVQTFDFIATFFFIDF